MIVATIDIWPYGSNSGKKTITTMQIANTGGNREVGNYEVEVIDDGKIVATGRVIGYKRKDHILSLISKAIASVGELQRSRIIT